MSEEKYTKEEAIKELDNSGILTSDLVGRIYEDPYLINHKLDALTKIYAIAIEQNDVRIVDIVNKKLIELIDKL